MRLAKPHLAMLHGWGMNARVFDTLTEWLADDFELHALSLPGHGGRAALPHNTLQSWADDLAQQLPPQSTLLGWSLGGQVAMRAALDHPHAIARLVLLSSTPAFVATAEWPAGMALDDLEAFGRSLIADPDATLMRFLSLQTRGMAEQKPVLQRLRQTFAAVPSADAGALASGLDILRDTDLRASVPHLTQPTLVLHGALDTLTPPAAGDWLAAHVPNAQRRILSRAAHAPQLSHSAEVAAAIREFAAHG
ncbi:pimeloyl-ACP methyl ester esterase BioH [Thiobacillus sp.]|uniref:pimeloyl-ACP methyl ester esterase BioH n=1 Tax=Thiobacillus sp. TaxID=924 RepID=UPI0025EAAC32|nr:pimeloyl-ACP methyl ester esterase BioH [Thiobacillus sp.]MBT9538777.1 pimeloyl-ACP methyl ester esterase BioH [Thiobacillus sp.]